jgi:hypothetical protein
VVPLYRLAELAAGHDLYGYNLLCYNPPIIVA